ncbi:MAG TPA: helix-turn-helix domain-containing protein [Firmicutes bacterium]|jgi:excisionase family DNA binding protein|nr:helix-turn-helix domain-containing protein [Bacillota bacterium]
MQPMTLDNMPEFLTVEEYRKLFRRGRSSAFEDIHSGRVRALRLGRRLLIPRSEVHRLVQEALEGGE